VTYKVEVSENANKERERLPKSVRLRLDAAIDKLAEDPRPMGSVKLVGEKNMFRIRVGNYRVIYAVFDDKLLVLIVRVRHRKDAYRK